LSDIPNKFDDTYYDETYYTTSEKYFRRSNGSLDHWGYNNPAGEWGGTLPIVEAWVMMFSPVKMLDAGCGRGTFIAYARDCGIEAEGFDFSEWAVKNPYPRCKPEWTKLHDATHTWPYLNGQFDFVTSLDFFEHFYEEDISFVADEVFRVSSKWVFIQIATVDGVKEKGYKLKKDEPVPVELEAYAVAGHVTVQTESYWIEKLNRPGWKLRPDMVIQFFDSVEPDVVSNWKANSVLVYEKVEG